MQHGKSVDARRDWLLPGVHMYLEKGESYLDRQVSGFRNKGVNESAPYLSLSHVKTCKSECSHTSSGVLSSRQCHLLVGIQVSPH